jgi:hypothetical protein
MSFTCETIDGQYVEIAEKTAGDGGGPGLHIDVHGNKYVLEVSSMKLVPLTVHQTVIDPPDLEITPSTDVPVIGGDAEASVPKESLTSMFSEEEHPRDSTGRFVGEKEEPPELPDAA